MQEFSIEVKKGQKFVHGKYSICSSIGQAIKLITQCRESYQTGRYSIYLYSSTKNVPPNKSVTKQHYQNQYKAPQTVQNIFNLFLADIGFTRLYQFGFQSEYNYMVMEILGPNLQQLLKLSGEKLSLKTIIILGLQMIDRIEVLHNAGYVYKDIKPQNFLIGLDNKSHILHLIDFGKSTRFKNKQTNKHIPYSQNIKFQADFLYSSLNTHNGIQYSRRDDLQGLIYLIIYLRKGKLPWSVQTQFKTKKQKESYIQQIKKRTPVQHLTYKMPLPLNDILYYVRTLNYYEKPDYDFVRMCLHKAFVQSEENWKMVFDWNLIDHMDYTLYNGEPKIVLKLQPNNNIQAQNKQQKKLQKQVQNQQLI